MLAVSVTGGMVGISVGVSVGVTGVMGMIPGVAEAVMLGIRMMGVGVKIPGVREGNGVQVGIGRGLTFHTSHAWRRRASNMRGSIFFM
jgi:hypothetical protein